MGQDDTTETHFCDNWVIEQIRAHAPQTDAWTHVHAILGGLTRSHQDAGLAAIVRAYTAGLVDLGVEQENGARNLLVKVLAPPK